MRFLFIFAALTFLAGCPPHPNGTACARHPTVARLELAAP